MRIPSGTTDQYIYFFAVDATDFTTPETGLTGFTVYRSRNGGAAAAFTTPTINETDSSNMAGVYELLLDEDMTIDSGDDEQEMVFYISVSGMAPVVRTITLFRPKITAGNTLGVESDGDLTKVNTLDGHTAQTGDSYALANGSAGFVAIDTVVDSILSAIGTPNALSFGATLFENTYDIFAFLDTIAGGLSLSDLNTAIGTAQADLNILTGTDGVTLATTQANYAPATATALASLVSTVGSAGAGLTEAGGTGDQLTAVPWNSSWDTEVESECNDALVALHLDHLLAATYDPASKPGVSDALFNELIESDAGVSRFTANALEEAPSGTGASAASIRAEIDANSTQLAAIVGDTNELQTNQGNWLTATGFSTHSAADVWSVVTRVLTAGTNIALAKGTGVTGFNDLDAAGIRSAVGLASANLDTQLAALPTESEIQAAITGGAYALDTDANGRIRIVDGTGAGELSLTSGLIDGIAGTIQTLDALDTAQDSQHSTTQSALTTIDSNVDAILLDTGELQADWANGGRLDLILDARASQTSVDDLPTNAELATALGDIPTAAEISADLLGNTVETGLTLINAMKLIAAASGGKLGGAATNTVTIRNAVADSKDRITATVDADGNRSAVTYDFT